MSTDETVVIRREGRLGRLTLNRPKALHALDRGMCEAMTAALLDWRDDAEVALVMLDHAGDRGFCAGGDIRMLAESGAADGVEARAFFLTEYRLNHLLFEYPKPVMAVMDGVTMGGGVGLSLPCRYRVATERTLFAMPETGIGLFPDVGGGWHLPRLPDHFGLWLALTGSRIKAADCGMLGIATHYVESARIGELKARVAAAPEAVDRVLAELAGDPGVPPTAAHRDDVAKAFGQPSVEAIMETLRTSCGEWGREQAALLATKSPQTMKVAFRQLQEGARAATFAENMRMEYRIGARAVGLHDFREGVRAVVVDKDHSPRWDPPGLEDVTDERLDGIFAPLPEGEEWTPLPGPAATQLRHNI